MTVGDFGTRTQKCLDEAGWGRDRKIDVESMVAVLHADGYEISTTVREFLQRFGELVLNYPHYRNPALVDHCHFDAATAARNVFPQQVTAWTDTARKTLCPVGEAFHDHMTLVMSPDGQVYAGLDDYLYFVGPSPKDAIESLCEGREIAKVE